MRVRLSFKLRIEHSPNHFALSLKSGMPDDPIYLALFQIFTPSLTLTLLMARR